MASQRPGVRFRWLLLAVFVAASAGEPAPKFLILGEVIHVASADDMRKGFKANGERVGAPKKWLKNCGYDPKSVADGQFALVRYFRYWHNETAGVIHDGARFAAVRPDLAVQDRNVVEVEADASVRGDCGAIASVRFADMAAGSCEAERDPKSGVASTLGKVNPIGGPGTQSINCPGLAEAGWERKPFGMYSGRAWIKTIAR